MKLKLNRKEQDALKSDPCENLKTETLLKPLFNCSKSNDRNLNLMRFIGV